MLLAGIARCPIRLNTSLAFSYGKQPPSQTICWDKPGL
jgi:hypothetical protein